MSPRAEVSLLGYFWTRGAPLRDSRLPLADQLPRYPRRARLSQPASWHACCLPSRKVGFPLTLAHDPWLFQCPPPPRSWNRRLSHPRPLHLPHAPARLMERQQRGRRTTWCSLLRCTRDGVQQLHPMSSSSSTAIKLIPCNGPSEKSGSSRLMSRSAPSVW